MASTHLNNSCGMYKLEQNINTNIQTTNLYKGQSIPRQSKYGNLGINNQRMIAGYYNNVLSNNPTDIESELYGIGSTNLVQKKDPVIKQLNRLDTETIVKPHIPHYIPQPLVVEKDSRPTGPFSS